MSQASETMSQTAQIEKAMRFVLLGLRELGDIPYSRCAMRECARILHLNAHRGNWWAKEEVGPYLAAAGFDESGRIVDHDRLACVLEARALKGPNAGRFHVNRRGLRENREQSATGCVEHLV
jgi:hypothetical protein